jgi:hypothetical protein
MFEQWDLGIYMRRFSVNLTYFCILAKNKHETSIFFSKGDKNARIHTQAIHAFGGGHIK